MTEAADRLVGVKADATSRTITVPRPRTAIALARSLLGQLLDALDQTMSDPGVRVVVLTGAGRVFCSGADLKETAVNPTVAAPLMADVLQELWYSPKPVISRVNGAA